MNIVDTQVLLHMKYYFAIDNPERMGSASGASLRVTQRTDANGRVSVAGSLAIRKTRLRPSGKIFSAFAVQLAFSVHRTLDDLVVLRTFDKDGHRNSTQHLFANDPKSELVNLLNTMIQRWCEPMSSWHFFDNPGGHVNFVQGPIFELRNRDNPIANQLQPAVDQLLENIHQVVGSLPDASARFPLLPQLAERGLGIFGHSFFLDAHNARQVAENAFGKTRACKPLTREIQRLAGDDFSRNTAFLNWFRLFRGLVPTDWIIDSMRSTRHNNNLTMNSMERRLARTILRQVPAPVLRRILKENANQTKRILKDATHAVEAKPGRILRDVNLLAAMIEARGQKNIRGAQDLENLIRSIPEQHTLSPQLRRSDAAVTLMLKEARRHDQLRNYNRIVEGLPDAGRPQATWEQWKDQGFRNEALTFTDNHQAALQTAQRREYEAELEARRLQRLEAQAERAAWARTTTAKLQKVTLEGWTLTVAGDAATLALWGSTMRNCIGGYSRDLGLDVFVGVFDATGRLRLNVQITHTEGITQFLGSNNRAGSKEVGSEAASMLLDAFIGMDIPVHQHALGVR